MNQTSHGKSSDPYVRGDEIRRNQLLEQHLPLVRLIVGRLRLRLPTGIDEEDLIGYGIIGLLDAVDKFDSSKGLKFETYAHSRIRGAIIDELRRISWVPRSTMDKLSRVQGVVKELEQQYQREVTVKEIADALNMDEQQVHEIINEVNYLSVSHLGELLMLEDRNIELIDTIRDSGPTPEQVLLADDTKKRLADNLGKLLEKEQTLLSLYYFEELTLREIGEVMGVSESRVSQLHSRALMRLRTLMIGDE